jgi:AmmeMemoRadiSam system protein A
MIELVSGPGRLRLLELARRAIEARVLGGPIPVAEPDGPERCPGGAFVTIHVARRLRGCLGRLTPDALLGETIIQLAAAVADSDPRFHPIEAHDLVQLRIEISVLTEPWVMSSPGDVALGRHGLIVEQGRRQGLLLPQVAVEYGWDTATFLARACVKAGLPEDAWCHGARVAMFEAQVFGEDDL